MSDVPSARPFAYLAPVSGRLIPAAFAAVLLDAAGIFLHARGLAPFAKIDPLILHLAPVFLYILYASNVARVDSRDAGFDYGFGRTTWRAQMRILFLGGGAIGTFSVVAALVFRLVGHKFTLPRLYQSPGEFWQIAPGLCVATPIAEECIYRAVLVPPLAARWGFWPALLVSGAVFGAMHFVGGNAGPDNFVAGYILAWAFLRSESLLWPTLYHGLGNLLVAVVLLVYYYHPAWFRFLENH